MEAARRLAQDPPATHIFPKGRCGGAAAHNRLPAELPPTACGGMHADRDVLESRRAGDGLGFPPEAFANRQHEGWAIFHRATGGDIPPTA